MVSVNEASIAEPPAAKGRSKQKKKPSTETPSSSGITTPINGVSSNGNAPNGNLNGNGEVREKGKLWEIGVEDTVIFPEGGGQPFDTGLMVIPASEGEVELVVEGCLRKKLESVHLVRVPVELEDAVKRLEGKEVTLKVDWERRQDHASL